MEILEESLQKERETSRRTVDEHVRALKSKEQEAEALKDKIAKLPTLADYQSLQRQLKIMQVPLPLLRSSAQLLPPSIPPPHPL